MKKLSIFLVLASLLMTSCLKDGFNDFNALKYPMSFHGEVSPTLGVPIGSGSATIFDMLQMVQISYAKMEVDSRGILTIVYDTSMPWHVDFDNSKGTKGGGAKSDIVHIARSSIAGSVAIDLFDNMTFLDTTQIEVDSLLVYFRAYLKAEANDSALAMMDKYHVHVYYDSLYIDVLGHDNQLYHIYPSANTASDSIPIENLIAGQYITLFNNTDISAAINHRPKEIHYGARMNIAFEAAFFASTISENEFVADSIGVTAIDMNGDIKVRFPVSAYIDNLRYQTDINFEPSFRLDDLIIDSSMIYLDCQNGIPMSLLVSAQFVDANDVVLCDILNPTVTVVEGAEVALNPATNLYTATNPKQTLVQVPITKPVFEALLNTKKIRLMAGLNTSPTGDPVRNRVSIQGNDKLNLRVWAKLKPEYTLDIDLGGNGSSEESQKGGAR